MSAASAAIAAATALFAAAARRWNAFLSGFRAAATHANSHHHILLFCCFVFYIVAYVLSVKSYCGTWTSETSLQCFTELQQDGWVANVKVSSLPWEVAARY